MSEEDYCEAQRHPDDPHLMKINLPTIHECIAKLKIERADSLREYCVVQAYRHALRAQYGHARAVFRAEYSALRRIWSRDIPEDDQGLTGAQ